ncbi:GTPase IMAP family member 8-like isoform X2 [Thunnus albacares]|uniref:GTPase IMAP family member 8-like isoform X2 n=1 Tax=Thunnus albacares TaxID=8236 RepID=UPI001CF6C400|nr:GTPase IMAP family member 8-like isoform X2 [Thunnus albacares]
MECSPVSLPWLLAYPEMDPDPDPDLTIVLLGDSGVGKSASGNSILGRTAFVSELSFNPVTEQICEQTGRVLGKKITVIDTPGILDSEVEIRTKCQDVLQSGRPHLFLVVLRVSRFTEEEERALEAAVRVLGDQGLKNSFLLFTGGDTLNTSLEEYIFQFKTSALKEWVHRFGERFHLFNNETDDRQQVKELLQKSEELRGCKELPGFNLPGVSITLLGNSGVGKSSTGNSILGREAFESKPSLKPVTTQICEQTGSLLWKEISVIDTPGILCAGAEEKIKAFCRDVLPSSRPKLFLVLLRVGRFTKDDQRAVEAAVRVVGDRHFETCYLLFTGGDALKNVTLEEFIYEDSEGPLPDLVRRFSERYHVFNNEDGGQEQVRDLLLKSADRLRKSVQLVNRRIVLIGPSGAGKSSSGNTILGSDQFTSDCSFELDSEERVCKSVAVEGHWVTVVETPGLKVRDPNLLFEEIMRMMMENYFVVIVVRIGRMSREDSVLIRILSESIIRRFSDNKMVLFTHGDELRGRSINQLIQSSSIVSQLVSSCRGRYCVFNNMETGNRLQVRKFMNIIDEMVVPNRRMSGIIDRRFFLHHLDFPHIRSDLHRAIRHLNEAYEGLERRL